MKILDFRSKADELKSLKTMSDAEICAAYNVDYPYEAKRYIDAFWHDPYESEPIMTEEEEEEYYQHISYVINDCY